MQSSEASRARVAPMFLTPGSVRLQALPPLALYVHIPWCLKKCPYCDFNSHEWRSGAAEAAVAGASQVPEAEYLAALRADLEAALPLVWGRKIVSVFIGGGTPSLFSAQAIDSLLSMVRALLPLNADAEITLEANPGTFEAEKFAAFAASGVNRLSVGVQSFNPAHLRALGRVHDDAQARAAVRSAQRDVGNFNLDLMFALPGQTLAQCREDVETALSFEPPHVSLYHLTLEPNTYFHRYPPALPDDDASAEMQDWIGARLKAAGYRRYEVSAFCRPDRASRHNSNYWQFGDYLGIGAGAHSKLSFPNRILRQMRHKQPKAYMQGAATGQAVQEEHEVAARDLPFEFMLNALRLADGVPVALFTERTGLPITAIQRELDAAEAKGLLVRDHQRIAATDLGWRFLNDLQQIFLAD
jgi:putative oxygen-independent coproporphyrinogen III oxidase